MASLPTILLILAALSMGATVIAALIAMRSAKEAESAIFPIVREEESKRAQRARLSIFVWIAITALFLGGWLATLRISTGNTGSELITPTDQVAAEAQPPAAEPAAVVEAVPPTDTPAPAPPPTETATPLSRPSVAAIESAPDATATPPPTASPTPEPTTTNTAEPSPTPTTTVTPTPTNTPLPDPSATLENTPTPEDTATPEPTSTPTVTPTPTALGSVNVSPDSSRTPAPPSVRVGPIQFTTNIDDGLDDIDPETTFAEDTESIYAVFPYQGMSAGLGFFVVWYQNGAEVARQDGVWEWGEEGRLYTFFSPPEQGLYKLELYINDTVVATKLFEVRE